MSTRKSINRSVTKSSLKRSEGLLMLFVVLFGFACTPSTITELPASEPTSQPIAGEQPMVTPTPEITSSAVPTQISPVDGMVQVFVPEGPYLTGLNTGRESVQVDAFWIDQTEVTNEKFRACVESGACIRSEYYMNQSNVQEYIYGSWTRESYYENYAYNNYPVIYVTWFDAANYCLWAGRRLPTTAEWEKAARGIDGRTFPWGNATPDASQWNGDTVAHTDTYEVGAFPQNASPYGALDMFGNAYEWLLEQVVRQYKNFNGVTSARHTAGYDNPEIRSPFVGFRCASDP